MAFSLNETTLLSAINSGSIFSIINSALSPSWSISFNKVDDDFAGAVSGSAVFTPTGWISAEPVGDAQVVSSPIQKGSYTSYNKVRRPKELRVKFALEGWTGYSGAIPNITNFTTLSRTELIKILDQMLETACTYDIETPDTIYTGYDLAHYDYMTSARQGLTLLTVSATFQAVMDVGEVTVSSQTTKTQASTNATSTQASAVTTDKTQSTATSSTLDQVKTAWTSANTSLSSALQSTSSAIVSGVNSAAESVSEAWESASTSVASQIKNGVSEFVSKVM
ncbi:hypothetical protein [Pantoea sp.]|uniref:hypothetical protein n=1 Tax=Pantoea sp. TaxID=69393 RepID=UPI0028AF8978|nr:hypothetical protein [Pantoea sp.]